MHFGVIVPFYAFSRFQQNKFRGVLRVFSVHPAGCEHMLVLLHIWALRCSSDITVVQYIFVLI